MSKSKEQYDNWLKRAIENGTKLVSYKCPWCEGEISALAPPPGQVYDTAVSCVHCEKLHFRVIQDGKVSLKKM
ncbi:hypothetical protein D3C87_936860 [compost metagenome]